MKNILKSHSLYLADRIADGLVQVQAESYRHYRKCRQDFHQGRGVYGLSAISYVRKSEKSYNSEIGLPLTILGAPNGWNNPLVWCKNMLKGIFLCIMPHKYPKWLILEVGIGKRRYAPHSLLA